MAIPITYKRGRFLVGMRRRDWTKVWLTIRRSEEDDERGRDIFLFSSDDEKVSLEDPRREEIA